MILNIAMFLIGFSIGVITVILMLCMLANKKGDNKDESKEIHKQEIHKQSNDYTY